MDLRSLLQRAYEPPEPAAEFQTALLTELKAQAGTRRRARRRMRLYAFGTVTALAASLLIAVALIPLRVEPPAAPILPVLLGASNTGQAAIEASQATEPSPTTAPWQGKVEGAPVRVLYPDREWADATGSLAVDKALSLRAVQGQTGVEIAPGVRLVMDKGSNVDFDNGVLSVKNGLVSLRVFDRDRPVEMRLPLHTLLVAPGSWLGVDMKPAENYAPGGSPAPEVTLLAGRASVKDAQSQGTLLPGRVYELHRYPNLENLPAERLGEDDLNRNPKWVQPTLVNFQIGK
ncbi:MAG: hypothetical protein V1918_06035 [Planctomycetota bacterium]